MKREITITYEWFDFDQSTNFKVGEILNEEAQKRVFSLIEDGFVSGQLFVEIDGVTYTGYWSLNMRAL